MNDLKTRFITALIVAPIVVACFISYKSLVGLVASIVMLSSFELMGFLLKDVPRSYVAYLTALSTLYPILYGLVFYDIPHFPLMVLFLTGAVSIMIYRKDPSRVFREYGAFSIALLYVSLGLSFFLPLYKERGAAVAVLNLTAVWAFDSFAYFAGLSLGRRKIFREYTNKSWEGVIGGFLGTLIYSVIYSAVSKAVGGGYLTFVEALFFSIIVSVMDTLGDVFESSLKRFAGVKDSGIIMPGHGGMLDRIDGLLFVTPVVYIFLHVW